MELQAFFRILRAPYLSFAYWWHSRRGSCIINVSYPNRIGHLCLEVDCFVKDQILSGPSPKNIFLKDTGVGFANQHLVELYLSQVLNADQRHPVFRYIERYGDIKGLNVTTAPYAVAMYETARAFETYARWSDRPPLFVLTPDDEQYLADYLRGVGLQEGDWYVALHARGGGYSPHDERFHSYRNVSIDSYQKAIDAIIARGGWCIRMGDMTMPAFSYHPRVIDYAVSEHKSERLDVCLSAGCHFFLGSASGLVNLAQIFGRPCAVTNLAPLSGAYTLGPRDISIPQVLLDSAFEPIGLRELMQNEACNFRITEEFEKAGLTPSANSPADIRDLVVEMLDRLDGSFVNTPEDDDRQAAFRAMFHEGHYSFGSPARIGRDFLRKNFV